MGITPRLTARLMVAVTAANFRNGKGPDSNDETATGRVRVISRWLAARSHGFVV